MEKRCVICLSKTSSARLLFALSFLALPWLAGCNLLFQTVAAEANPAVEATTPPPWLLPPTATPLPPPTATPLPTPTPRPRVIVTDDLVNVRASPSTDGEILGTVVKDATLEFLGQNDTGEWVQICCVQGGPGWVFHELVQKQASGSSAANPAQMPSPVAITGWQTFASPELGFSIVLPGMPVKQTTTLQTSVGPLDYYLFSTNFEEGKYTLGFVKLPSAGLASDGFLNSVRDDLIVKAHGQVSQEQMLEQDGVVGRELTILPPNARNLMLVRLYLEDDHLYVLTVTVPKEQVQSENVSRFFDSFQVLQA